MLDPTTINAPEPNKPLKCELCGLSFEDNEDEGTDWQSIDETGRCINCCELYGLFNYPDRL